MTWAKPKIKNWNLDQSFENGMQTKNRRMTGNTFEPRGLQAFISDNQIQRLFVWTMLSKLYRWYEPTGSRNWNWVGYQSQPPLPRFPGGITRRHSGSPRSLGNEDWCWSGISSLSKLLRFLWWNVTSLSRKSIPGERSCTAPCYLYFILSPAAQWSNCSLQLWIYGTV